MIVWSPIPPYLSDKIADWECLCAGGGEELIKGKDVLDVGACWGTDALTLCSHAKTYVAADGSPEVLDHLRACMPKKVTVQFFDARERWPLDDASVDTVLDFSSFDDTGDADACYAEAARVLRPGGVLVSTYANACLIPQEVPYAKLDPTRLARYLGALGLSIKRRLREDQVRACVIAFKRTTMSIDRDKAYWSIASGFSPDKEGVYPDHAGVQEFELARDKDVLEYGCGGGSDAMSFLRRGARVTYVDIVPKNVEVATARIASRLLKGGTPILLEASNRIPVPDASFDIVSSHGVLHHIVDVKPVVAELFRILRPGGFIYAMLYTEQLRLEAEAKVHEWCATKGISPEEAFGWYTDGVGTPYAIRYTVDEGWALLEGAGFERVSFAMSNGDRFRTFKGRKP